MEHTMSWLVPFVILVVVFCIIAIVVQKQLAKERAGKLRRVANSQGWQFIPEDDSYATRWDGKPFTGNGKARNVVHGQHRGRYFEAFEYSYTTSSYNGTTSTTTTHRFSIWTISLPSSVPNFAVGEEGLFGGRVAEAFGYERVQTEDVQFNDTFKITSDDHQFGQRLLTPDVIDWLKQVGPQPWRLTERTMIAYDKGPLEAGSLQPRLEWMCDLLDRFPAEVWSAKP